MVSKLVVVATESRCFGASDEDGKQTRVVLAWQIDGGEQGGDCPPCGSGSKLLSELHMAGTPAMMTDRAGLIPSMHRCITLRHEQTEAIDNRMYAPLAGLSPTSMSQARWMG